MVAITLLTTGQHCKMVIAITQFINLFDITAIDVPMFAVVDIFLIQKMVQNAERLFKNLTDILSYGETDCNRAIAVCLHDERYPEHPNCRILISLVCFLGETDCM
jgi:hypothetical protein